MPDNPYRLPRHAVPERYDLELEPDLEHGRFRGTAVITLDVRETTDTLVANALELEIDSATVTSADGVARPTTATFDEVTERVELKLTDRLAPGRAVLTVSFRGILNDKLRGWYRSTFKDGDGRERVIATTQMQATDCRRAFPCWDEPDLKAVFGITLVVDDGLLAVSNGPEIGRSTRADGKLVVRFADTMVMSSYLVAMIVGPLEATKPIDVDGIPMRIVHVPGKSDLTSFAEEIGPFALRWFQEYYGIAYPGEKVDLVALPDFAAGAMENLGCITFRENLLLVDRETSTPGDEQIIADVVAHELAHMWFGDLVTMKWWNGIWLNEAFATFMEVAACDAFRPAWQRWVAFSLERTSAFDTDALASTRPVEFEVVSPDDADGMFDVLTYKKGGALLRMLEQHLGTETFRDGIRHYLRTHAHGNTETADLWDAIEHTSGAPVRRIMDSWIWQGGYPLVSARVVGTMLVLTQRRFQFGGHDDPARWAIPVHVRQSVGGAQREERLLLDGDRAELPLLSPDATVVVNAEGEGFFRVAYDATLLGRLTGAAFAELSTLERCCLVDDTWAAVVAGELTVADFLGLVEGGAGETDLAVWQNVLAGLRWCGRFVEGEARDRFRAFVRTLVGPALERLGWEGRADESDLTTELRGLLIGALAVLGHDADAQARARALHRQAVTDPTAVDPSVAAAALSVVANTGDVSDYDAYLATYRTSDNPQEKLRYLLALAEFGDPALMARTLELSLSDDVRVQNAPTLLARCIGHRDLGEQAWQFVRMNWEHMNDVFPNTSIVRMVDTVKTLTRPEQQADVAAFFAEHAIPQAAKTLEQVLERQKVNVALRARTSPMLSQRFAAS